MDELYLNNKQISFQEFISLVIKWMIIGIGLSAVTSLLILIFGIINILNSIALPVTIVFAIVELMMVFLLCKKIQKLDVSQAKLYFVIYSIINGITLTFIIEGIAPGIVFIAFALTCAYFGLLHAIATHTSYDFSHIGIFCMAVLPILIIGYIILLFIQAPILYYLLILSSLVIFTGLTIYDMKMIKTYYLKVEQQQLESISILCALQLYLDFINIFIDILRILNDLK